MVDNVTNVSIAPISSSVFINGSEFLCSSLCNDYTNLSCASCVLANSSSVNPLVLNMTEANLEAECLYEFENNGIQSTLGDQMNQLAAGNMTSAMFSQLNLGIWSGCVLLDDFQNQMTIFAQNLSQPANITVAVPANQTVAVPANQGQRRLRAL
jgi:hypothetical protein